MIRLSKQTDYGIVLLSHLARQGECRYTAPDLAAETRLPLPMVSKILKLLAREGVLISRRGVKGGYELARSPRQISVATIITALDGPIAITECIEDSPDACSYEAYCQVRTNWQRINGAVRRALEEITLEEMAQPWPPLASSTDEELIHLGHEAR